MTNPMTHRLEELRGDILQIPLMRFVEILNTYDGPRITYPSALRYHRDRTPTAEYLTRVSTAFDVTLDWLMKGTGMARDDADELLTDRMESLRESSRLVIGDIASGYGDNAEWITSDPAIRFQLLRCQRRKDAGYRKHVAMLTGETVGVEVGLQVSRGIGKALRAAVNALDVDPNTLSPGAREDLVVAFAQMVIAVENAPPAGAKIVDAGDLKWPDPAEGGTADPPPSVILDPDPEGPS